MRNHIAGRTILFFIVLVIILNMLSFLFRESDPSQTGGYEDYKSLPEGSVDAVYIGNSGVSRYWICSEAYDKYGMVVFPLSTDGMPSWLVESMLCEAYKYQTPELAIIDVRAFTQVAAEDNCEAENHYILDRLPWFSANRIESVIRTIKVQAESKSKNMPKFGLAYFLPVLSYHDIWLDHDLFSTKEDEDVCSFLGYYARKYYSVRGISEEQASELEKSVNTSRQEKRVPIDPTAEKSLRRLIRYIEEKNINVLFLASPTQVDETLAGKYNTISDILSDSGYQLFAVNAADIGEYEFCYKNDFLDQMHVNYFGAKKYTDFLADYLKTEYHFTDHRNDPAVAK